MNLQPVTKLDDRNMVMLKKIDNDVMSENRDVIFIFPIYDRFGPFYTFSLILT